VNTDIDTIHAFWFGELDATGLSPADRHALWFTASAESDEACRERFGSLVEQALAGKLSHWMQSDKGLIALVLPWTSSPAIFTALHRRPSPATPLPWRWRCNA
jgi:uncharacterized protein (DUF924 family)